MPLHRTLEHKESLIKLSWKFLKVKIERSVLLLKRQQNLLFKLLLIKASSKNRTQTLNLDLWKNCLLKKRICLKKQDLKT